MRHLAMSNGKACADPQAFKSVEFNNRVIAVLSGEYIVEPLTQPSHGFSHGITRYRTSTTIAERSQIIDPVGMVGMVMSPEHGIDPVDPMGQELRS